ncbi:unnamed protein product [Taenia asiatica]|uniref:Uncharacterized protein n=1 Tax=Taenia asiatica TaxID=60517 RepID=A0A0R3W3C3_TAEAS|nr:unnamed protein product [Taenia asiatica]
MGCTIQCHVGRRLRHHMKCLMARTTIIISGIMLRPPMLFIFEVEPKQMGDVRSASGHSEYLMANLR